MFCTYSDRVRHGRLVLQLLVESGFTQYSVAAHPAMRNRGSKSTCEIILYNSDYCLILEVIVLLTLRVQSQTFVLINFWMQFPKLCVKLYDLLIQGRRHQSGWSGFNLTTFQVKVCIEERGTIVAQAQKIIRLSPPAQARK